MSGRRRQAALAAAALLAAAPLAAAGDARYYRSNPIGIPFEEIDEAAAAGHRFVLVRRPADGGSERVLLDAGRQVRRWVSRRGAGGVLVGESDYADGALAAERSYDSEGRLTEESTYDGGRLVSRAAYTYERRLVRVEATDAAGAVLYRATWRLAASGHLRDFVHVAPGEEQHGVRFVFADGSLVEEVVTAGSTRLVSRYLAGEPYEIEEWRGDVLHEVRALERSPAGAVVTETVTEPARDRRTVRRFDADGRVQEVVVTERGARVELTRHQRDRAGRIVATRRQTAAGDERLQYRYVVGAADAARDGPDDRLRSLRHEQDDELISVAVYTWPAAADEPPTRQVDYFRDGAPHLRVHYRGDVRTREQVLRDGRVIRERVFEDG